MLSMMRLLALSSLLLMGADAPPSDVPAVLDTPAVREVVALAQKTQLPATFTIVCLGDSITFASDRQPVKYPEMLNFALQKKHGENVRVFNAGRGGDSATTALARLEADVLARKPDLVFINLGVNDSKLAAPAYERNSIPIETFKTDYAKILATIKEKTSARVVVVGTIACVDEWTIRATQREKKGNWFGKPEELVRYNAAAAEIAKAAEASYVDLYDHFRAQPDMKSFFNEPDGVHCRDKGQEQIALQLMRFLVTAYPAK